MAQSGGHEMSAFAPLEGTAKALGIDVPDRLLALANEVIE
jgi:hypothetical protein